jgi:hypothetical protein
VFRQTNGPVAAPAALLLALLMLCAQAATHLADSGKFDRVPLTSGSNYDRNPSVIQHANETWLFFARSEAPCDRLSVPGCNPDNSTYDLYYLRSSNNGKTWGPPVLVADNPHENSFYGRTVAATRAADGSIYLFWASGGGPGNLYYFRKAPDSNTFTPLGSLDDISYFNVEAVAAGNTVFVYYEDATGAGIYVRTFDGANFSAPALVAAARNIPKVIIDKRGVFRMAMVSALSFPVVNVEVASSADGLNWGPATVAVNGDGTVTNWDPTLAQTPDGTFQLFWAPDQNDGRQRVESVSSGDFAAWSAPVVHTEGTDGETAYWDYWPEATPQGNRLNLFYTSERGIGGDPGTGHIWTTRIK